MRSFVLISRFVVTVYSIMQFCLILKAFSIQCISGSIASSSLPFSESRLFPLYPGPSFLHFSLYLPLDQILRPGPYLDVRLYMLTLTILDSHPMFLEIDL